jgi:hypothetical protein
MAQSSGLLEVKVKDPVCRSGQSPGRPPPGFETCPLEKTDGDPVATARTFLPTARIRTTKEIFNCVTGPGHSSTVPAKRYGGLPGTHGPRNTLRRTVCGYNRPVPEEPPSSTSRPYSL